MLTLVLTQLYLPKCDLEIKCGLPKYNNYGYNDTL